jgi:hypothetical protein
MPLFRHTPVAVPSFTGRVVKTNARMRLSRSFIVVSLLAAAAGCRSSNDGMSSVPIEPVTKDLERTAGAAPRVKREEASPTPFEDDTRSAILIVLDGARWQDVYEGADRALGDTRGFNVAKVDSGEKLMPNLHALMARGVAIGARDHGESISASGPNFISLPGYMEIMTGTRTACTENECGRVKVPTIADDVRAVSKTNEEVAVVASWPVIENAAAMDLGRIVLTTGCRHTVHPDAFRVDRAATHLFFVAESADPFPGEGEYRPDALTAQIALKYLAARHPRFMFIGLGDMDEFAHKNDYRDYTASMQAADKVIGSVMKIVDGMGDRGQKTTIFVTADHGRSDGFRSHGGESPESANVFLVAAGGDIPARGLVSPTKKHHLSDIAPTIRSLLGLVPRTSDTAGEPIAEIVDAK